MPRRGGRGEEAPQAVDEDGSPLYLISIKPRYALQIFKSIKRFELRRNIRGLIPEGSVMVVYASGNMRAIIGEFRVGKVLEGSPEEVWRSVMAEEDQGGVREDAWHYIKGSQRAMALEVVKPRMYKWRPRLEDIRRIIPGWSPPLSYKALREGEPLYELVVRKLRRLSA